MTVGFFNYYVMGQPAFAVPAQVVLELVVLAAVLAYFDTARRHELLILANFGVAKSTVVILAAAPAVVLELLLATASLL